MDVAHIACRPGEKRYLVDRRKEWHPVGVVVNVVSQGFAVARKTVHKRCSKDVHIVGAAVVQHVPEDLHTVPVRRLHQGSEGREVELTGALDERPASAIPDSTNIEAA